MNLVAGAGRAVRGGPGAVVLQFASPSFDASVSEVCVTLAAGGTLVVPGARERADPVRLAALARARGGRSGDVAAVAAGGAGARGELAGVGTVVSAGERLDPAVAGAWRPGRRLLNAYGPTEATVCATLAVTGPGDAGAPPIGSPAAQHPGARAGPRPGPGPGGGAR